MENSDQSSNFSCTPAILSCLALSITYVASFYVWQSPYNREDPDTIKKRFFSVFIVSLISPLSLYFGLDRRILKHNTVWELLGLRWSGLIQATLIPLCLTMILFLGPLTLQISTGLWRIYTKPIYWIEGIKTLYWWRNLVVAPLSEEWTFRACMLPLLLQCFAPSNAIFICSLFFGIVHFHHIVERKKMGIPLKHALPISCLQFGYTTLFGAYASFLFVKTGHFAAPVAAHTFCNHMGFPDLSEIIEHNNPIRKFALLFLFLVGLVVWSLLLNPLTNPIWFNNNLFWQK